MTWCAQVDRDDADRLHAAIGQTKIMAPPTNCLVPIGPQQILKGLLKEIKAEFYTAETRDPAVYRGNPFQIEVGLAYGGQLPADDSARVIRFANRVPLLYQPRRCAITRSVLDTNWRNYAMAGRETPCPKARWSSSSTWPACGSRSQAKARRPSPATTRSPRRFGWPSRSAAGS